MQNSSLSLSELLGRLSHTISEQFPGYYWVRVEISEARQNASGHFFCHFIEKNDAGQDIASVNGIIWYNYYSSLRPGFERVTGQSLKEGIKVLVKVKVNFSGRYGLSLIVYDIDPSYTLGDMVRRRKEILDRLKADGVIEMNRSLTLPRPLMRIAVISSRTAAGYGDFINQIHSRGGTFRFVTKLFPATMQGDAVESSVIAALNAIAAEMEKWDAVTIIRGGGAVSDLNGFESYALANNVAQFPLPVITGIGHERDKTVIDFVANTYLKTPTAVADFLIEKAKQEENHIGELLFSLHKTSSAALYSENRRLSLLTSSLHKSRITVEREKTRLTSDIKDTRSAFSIAISSAGIHLRDILMRLPAAVSRICAHAREIRMQTSVRLATATKNMLVNDSFRIKRAEKSLQSDTETVIRGQRADISLTERRLAAAVSTLLQCEKNRLSSIDSSLRFAGPERIFRLGFSLTLKDGKAVRDASMLKEGDIITTRLEKGSVKSRVERKH